MLGWIHPQGRRKSMTIVSFELKAQPRFDQRVICPSKLSDTLKFSSNIQQRQQEQKTCFRDGIHFCPVCTGFLLRDRGFVTEGGKLIDASQRDQVIKQGLSDRSTDVGAALSALGLFSDGRAHRDIATNFYVCSSPSKVAPSGRVAGYRHLKGRGVNCDRASLEHSVIIDLLIKTFKNFVLSAYPDADLSYKIDQKLDGSCRRRPDVQLFLKDKEVTSTMALEIQQSHITMEEWIDRHSDLCKECNNVVWVFKWTRSYPGRSHYPILRKCVENKIPALVYQIQGEPYSEDNDLILRWAEEWHPDPSSQPVVTQFGVGKPSCDRSALLEKHQEHDKAKPRVSRSSVVKFNNLDRLGCVVQSRTSPSILVETQCASVESSGSKLDVILRHDGSIRAKLACPPRRISPSFSYVFITLFDVNTTMVPGLCLLHCFGDASVLLLQLYQGDRVDIFTDPDTIEWDDDEGTVITTYEIRPGSWWPTKSSLWLP